MHAFTRSSDTVTPRDTSAPTIVVHDDYGDDIPPHPGQDYTRFVCISDTHSKTFPLPAGDVLIHSGDLCSWGTVKQLKVTMDWLVSLPHPTKIIIAGNHDLCLDETRVDAKGFQYSAVTRDDVAKARSMMKNRAAVAAGLHYLEHESMELKRGDKTWKVYGSPAAPRFMPGSFQYEYEDSEGAEAIYKRVPRDTEILLTHTPPYGVLDGTQRGAHVGCDTLAETLGELKRCRLHVFGHIHESHGAFVHQEEERVSVNAAMAGWPTRQAIIVDLKH